MAATGSLDDPSAWRVIRRVPIFDEHEPVEKVLVAHQAISETNPKGLVRLRLGASKADLETMARNSNARARSGRFAPIQLGHTRAWDTPEKDQPKHVGRLVNFTVGEHEGKPHLFADLAYQAADYAEAMTYHHLSINWKNWQPDHRSEQFVEHLALLRSEPGRDLPAVPYGGRSSPSPALAGRSFPNFSSQESADVKYARDRQVRINAIIRKQLAEKPDPTPTPSAADMMRSARDHAREAQDIGRWAARRGIKSPAAARKAYDEARLAGAVSYSRGPSLDESEATKREASKALVDFATRHGIRNAEEARRQFARLHPQQAGSLGYSAGPIITTPLDFQNGTNWGMPNSGSGLELKLDSPGFRKAVVAYATRHGIASATTAGNELAQCVRAHLVGWSDAGELVFPEPPVVAIRFVDGKRVPNENPESYYKRRRLEFLANMEREAKASAKAQTEERARAVVVAERSRSKFPTTWRDTAGLGGDPIKNRTPGVVNPDPKSPLFD